MARIKKFEDFKNQLVESYETFKKNFGDSEDDGVSRYPAGIYVEIGFKSPLATQIVSIFLAAEHDDQAKQLFLEAINLKSPDQLASGIFTHDMTFGTVYLDHVINDEINRKAINWNDFMVEMREFKLNPGIDLGSYEEKVLFSIPGKAWDEAQDFIKSPLDDHKSLIKQAATKKTVERTIASNKRREQEVKNIFANWFGLENWNGPIFEYKDGEIKRRN